MRSGAAGVVKSVTQGDLVAGRAPSPPGGIAAKPPSQSHPSVVSESLERREALVGDPSIVARRQIGVDHDIAHGPGIGDGSLVAGRFRPLDRLFEAGLGVVEASVRVKGATKVGQDREAGRVVRVEQRRRPGRRG